MRGKNAFLEKKHGKKWGFFGKSLGKDFFIKSLVKNELIEDY
jgi:hypothetical protein